MEIILYANSHETIMEPYREKIQFFTQVTIARVTRVLCSASWKLFEEEFFVFTRRKGYFCGRENFRDIAKHLCQTHKMYLCISPQHIYLTCTWKVSFTALCSWHRNFYHSNGPVLYFKEKPLPPSLPCRMTSHNYANNFFLLCVFCRLDFWVLRVT